MDASANFLVLDPEKELEFRRPFTSVVKQTLHVTNYHSDAPIAFKVKTTAPKQYCVRPNSGRILPNETAEVQVQLQAMREDPPLDFKCKDKFLVQSIRIPFDVMRMEGDELAARLQELWAQAEQLKKTDPEGSAKIMCEKKLRCVYLPPAAADGSAAVAAAAAAVPVAARQTLQPQASFDSSSQHHGQASSYMTDSDSGITARTPVMSISSATSRADNKAPLSTNGTAELTDLREAQKEIHRLKNACEGYRAEIERLNLLRQRRAAAGAGDAGDAGSKGAVSQAALVQAQSHGLSVQIVALLALISFILGVILF
ncbi:phosphatidylinositol-binding protein scs2 [Quaeritorhiza haematococci]|nr:phosphatidylinositol-binding protein scs2 [Quaeritorhiza haematococci]